MAYADLAFHSEFLINVSILRPTKPLAIIFFKLIMSFDVDNDCFFIVYKKFHSSSAEPFKIFILPYISYSHVNTSMRVCRKITYCGSVMSVLVNHWTVWTKFWGHVPYNPGTHSLNLSQSGLSHLVTSALLLSLLGHELDPSPSSSFFAF